MGLGMVRMKIKLDGILPVRLCFIKVKKMNMVSSITLVNFHERNISDSRSQIIAKEITKQLCETITFCFLGLRVP